MRELVPWIILAVVALGVGIFALVRVAQRRRREAWERAAAGLGFSFAPEAPSFLAEFGSLKVFSRGHSHRLRNLASGDTVVVHRSGPIRPEEARELLEQTGAIAALLRERAATTLT